MFCKVSYQKLLNHLQIFMSKEEYLRELLKWVSSDSLLVLDKLGKLRRVYVPFWVVSLIDFP
jgi:hypothetical protein